MELIAVPHTLSICFPCSVWIARRDQPQKSVCDVYLDVQEHKAKPRRKTEGLSGITPDFHSPIDVLTAGWLVISTGSGQLWLCSAKSCNPWGGRTHTILGWLVPVLHHPPGGKAFPNVQCDSPKPQLVAAAPCWGGFGSIIFVTPLQVIVDCTSASSFPGWTTSGPLVGHML